ncbi:hypothetical protein [Nakamurella endophytica]|uniref:hypothetical protein n=1 Tax=Nakamurella endophytica TaxID=1748367 RepID=UPI0016690ED7|nr:hypothetical protein [Nakamurella endophytica]
MGLDDIVVAADIPLRGSAWLVGFLIFLVVIGLMILFRVRGVGGRSSGDRGDPARRPDDR